MHRRFFFHILQYNSISFEHIMLCAHLHCTHTTFTTILHHHAILYNTTIVQKYTIFAYYIYLHSMSGALSIALDGKKGPVILDVYSLMDIGRIDLEHT